MGIHNGKERVHGMSEEENVQELIQTPHGVQESIKMDLLEWIQEARDPYLWGSPERAKASGR